MLQKSLSKISIKKGQIPSFQQNPLLYLCDKYKDILEETLIYKSRAPNLIAQTTSEERKRLSKILFKVPQKTQPPYITKLPQLNASIFREEYESNKLKARNFVKTYENNLGTVKDPLETIQDKKTFENEQWIRSMLHYIWKNLDKYVNEEEFKQYTTTQCLKITDQPIEMDIVIQKENASCIQQITVLQELKKNGSPKLKKKDLGENMTQEQILLYHEIALLQAALYADHHYISRKIRYPILLNASRAIPQQSLIYCGRKTGLIVPQFEKKINTQKVLQKEFTIEDLIEIMSYDLTNFKIGKIIQDPNIHISDDNLAKYLYNELKIYFK